jgi:hypothetical protein
VRPCCTFESPGGALVLATGSRNDRTGEASEAVQGCARGLKTKRSMKTGQNRGCAALRQRVADVNSERARQWLDLPIVWHRACSRSAEAIAQSVTVLHNTLASLRAPRRVHAGTTAPRVNLAVNLAQIGKN